MERASIQEKPKELSAPNLRQQDKIAKALLSGDVNVMSQSDVSLSPKERDAFLSKLADGSISNNALKGALLSIRAPYHGEADPREPHSLFAGMSGNRQIRGILADLVKHDLSQRSTLAPHDLGEFITRFPEPLSLEEPLQDLFRRIEKGNTPQKREEYEDAARVLLQTVYGKQYEYAQQIKFLKEEAQKRPAARSSERAQEVSPMEVSEEEAKKMLENLEIHGGDFNGKYLTKEILEKSGLSPKYRVRVGDMDVCLSSQAYDLGGGRPAVVGYIEKDGKMVPRSFYRSNSQGVWRYLPNYELKDGDIKWYGKGYGEESATLPIPLQEFLSSITQFDEQIARVADPKLIFAGTARRVDEGATYFSEVESKEKVLDGSFYPQERGKKVPPEQVSFKNPQQEPDFTKKSGAWEQPTATYGKVTMEVYPSKDGTLSFLFCRDESGRAWISSIEDTESDISSVALRKTWISGGDLTTPAVEYYIPERNIDQTGGYGNPNRRSGSYVDMYENYVSKIPVIQEYLNHLSNL
ncbi:MAG: hypothetical protein Q7R79_01515 [bacterium]|nr:hypothetical protein [bacterium]